MKKVMKTFAMVFSLVTVAMGSIGLTTHANNNSPYPLKDGSSPFSVTNTGNYTMVRAKEDNSSAVIMISETNPSGSKASVSVCNGNRVVRNYNGPKLVGVSSYYTALANNVYESGDRSCCLRLMMGTTTTGASSFTASGSWSPDSNYY